MNEAIASYEYTIEQLQAAVYAKSIKLSSKQAVQYSTPSRKHEMVKESKDSSPTFHALTTKD